MRAEPCARSSSEDLYSRSRRHPVVTNELVFSRHANQRLRDRHLRVSATLMEQLVTAVDSLARKGSRSALIMTEQLALLVSVNNRTVITVIANEQLKQQLFTDIDSALFLSLQPEQGV